MAVRVVPRVWVVLVVWAVRAVRGRTPPMVVRAVPVVRAGPPVLVLWVRRVWMGRRGRVTGPRVALVVLVVWVRPAVRLVPVVPGSMVGLLAPSGRRVTPRLVAAAVWAVRVVPGLTPVV